MISACHDNGLAPPVWEEVGFRLRVTLRTGSLRSPTIDPKDRTILDLLSAGEGRGTREIAEAIGLSTRSTRTRLARLVKRGLVREVGTGPNDPRRKYLIALDG